MNLFSNSRLNDPSEIELAIIRSTTAKRRSNKIKDGTYGVTAVDELTAQERKQLLGDFTARDED